MRRGASFRAVLNEVDGLAESTPHRRLQSQRPPPCGPRRRALLAVPALGGIDGHNASVVVVSLTDTPRRSRARVVPRRVGCTSCSSIGRNARPEFSGAPSQVRLTPGFSRGPRERSSR